jgi:hypothetical protein
VARQEAVAIQQRVVFCVGLDVAQPVSLGVWATHGPAERAGLGLPRFDGQGWWLGQAACWMTSSWAAVSNSLGVR